MLLPHTKVINFYGPTEATIGVSHWLANGGNYEGVSTLPIGPPMANTHLYVLDADLKQVPVGRLVSSPTSIIQTCICVRCIHSTKQSRLCGFQSLASCVCSCVLLICQSCD